MADAVQIVVLGPHRSGTSAVAGTIARMGAYHGPLETEFPYHPANPKGFYERQDVVELNDALLEAVGDTWCRVERFRADNVPPAAMTAFQVGARVIAADLAAHPVSVLKDPRLCLTMPLWRPLLSNPVCLIVVRHPVDAALSLMVRDAIPLAVGLALWERYLRDALAATVGLPRLTVMYDMAVDRPGEFAIQVADELRVLGVQGLDPSLASGWIEEELRHRHTEWQENETLLSLPQRDLGCALRAGTALDEPPTPLSETSQSTLALYNMTMAIQDGAREAVAERDAQLAEARALQAEAAHHRDDVAARLRRVRALLDALFASWRWRLGDRAVDLIRTLLRRPTVPQPRDEIESLLGNVPDKGETD
jgi:hypothetical protein